MVTQDSRDKEIEELETALARSREKVTNLEEEIVRVSEALDEAVAAANRAGDDGRADRLWTAITTWFEKHKAGCFYAKSGAFCFQCKWVYDLIRKEEEGAEGAGAEPA